MPILPQPPEGVTTPPADDPEARSADAVRGMETWPIEPYLDGHDDEEFCPDCFAGMESSQHHAECIAPLDQLDGGAA